MALAQSTAMLELLKIMTLYVYKSYKVHNITWFSENQKKNLLFGLSINKIYGCTQMP